MVTFKDISLRNIRVINASPGVTGIHLEGDVVEDVVIDNVDMYGGSAHTRLIGHERTAGNSITNSRHIAAQPPNAAQPPKPRSPRPQRRVDRSRQPGRNDPCWCGSGDKFKKCHGA